MLVAVLHSLIFFVMLVVVAFTFPGYFSMPPALHYGFSGS